MANVVELTHPLARHHLAMLRAASTPPHVFRAQASRLTTLLTCEATRQLPLRSTRVETPLTETECHVLKGRIGLVPILRAGLAMLDAVQQLIPESEVWHLGFYRDEETLQPVEYYQKFSDDPPDHVFVLDPMLATGGSASEAITRIKRWGAKRIIMMSLIAAPEGVQRVTADHPDVEIFVCAIDDHLNERAYIVPGLGDAGDRVFNTL